MTSELRKILLKFKTIFDDFSETSLYKKFLPDILPGAVQIFGEYIHFTLFINISI